MNPAISVLLPAYNVGPYISDAIQSILSQSFADFEIIVVNDASTDNTEEKILNIRDKRIVYVKNAKNLGIVESLNKAIDIARGEFLARMDGDDLSHPDRFKKQVSFLDKNTEVGVCGTWLEKFGVVNRIIKAIEKPREIKFSLALNTSVPHATMLARACVFHKNDIKYSSEHIYAEDYSLFVQMSQHTQLATIPEVLYRYRIHDENISVTKAATVITNAAKARFEYLKQNLLGVFSEDILRNVANAWAAEDHTLDKETVQQLLVVYELWYELVIGSDNLEKQSVFREIVNQYFLNLLRYKCKKSPWAVAYHFKNKVYHIPFHETLKSVARAALRR